MTNWLDHNIHYILSYWLTMYNDVDVNRSNFDHRAPSNDTLSQYFEVFATSFPRFISRTQVKVNSFGDYFSRAPEHLNICIPYPSLNSCSDRKWNESSEMHNVPTKNDKFIFPP